MKNQNGIPFSFIIEKNKFLGYGILDNNSDNHYFLLKNNDDNILNYSAYKNGINLIDHQNQYDICKEIENIIEKNIKNYLKTVPPYDITGNNTYSDLKIIIVKFQNGKDKYCMSKFFKK